MVSRLQEHYTLHPKVDMNGGDQIPSQQVIVEDPIIEPKKIEVVQPTTAIESEATTQKRPAEFTISEEERKRLRAEKFGVAVESVKIAKRGERFGTGEAADKATMEKIKNRAERFGVVSPIVQTAEEKDRIEKRRERFGNDTTTTISSDSAIAKRQNRFGVVEPEKPKIRPNNNNRQFNNNRRRF